MARQENYQNRRRTRHPRQKTGSFRKQRRKLQPEFREDALGGGFLKVMRFTRQQWMDTLRWGLYALICILCLVVQDVIMSRIHLLDTTTDLAAGIILLITVMSCTEVGSVFVLITSTIYYFSGSSPGPYTVGLMTTIGIVATMFRQQYLHRSVASIVVTTGLALVVYELGVYSVGLFLGLTRWDRIFAFLLTALYTTAVMLPMYYLINRIGQIGGHTWKE